MHTWSGHSGIGTSRAFLNQLLNKIADNRPGANKQAKLSEMTQALSCIVAAQVAEQITAAVGPWEIPVMPAWEVPLRTDEHGNSLPGVKRSPKDSYSELNRRTRPRRDSSPPRAHPQTRTDLNTAPELGSQTTPPEYSPSFMIPSGPGGLQSAEPSPMDVLPRFQTVSTTTSPGIPALTGDAEADRLIQQLVEAGDWTPLSNELSLLEPLNSSSSNFAFNASSLLNDLMACLTDEPGAPLTGDLPLAEGLGDPGPLAPPLLLLPLDVGHETTSQSGVTFREGGVQSVSPPSSRTRSSQPKAPARRFASGLPPLK